MDNCFFEKTEKNTIRAFVYSLIQYDKLKDMKIKKYIKLLLCVRLMLLLLLLKKN